MKCFYWLCVNPVCALLAIYFKLFVPASIKRLDCRNKLVSPCKRLSECPSFRFVASKSRGENPQHSTGLPLKLWLQKKPELGIKKSSHLLATWPNNNLKLWLLGSIIFTRSPGLEIVPVLQQFKGESHGKELKTGKLVCRTVLKS